MQGLLNSPIFRKGMYGCYHTMLQPNSDEEYYGIQERYNQVPWYHVPGPGPGPGTIYSLARPEDWHWRGRTQMLCMYIYISAKTTTQSNVYCQYLLALKIRKICAIGIIRQYTCIRFVINI